MSSTKMEDDSVSTDSGMPALTDDDPYDDEAGEFESLTGDDPNIAGEASTDDDPGGDEGVDTDGGVPELRVGVSVCEPTRL